MDITHILKPLFEHFWFLIPLAIFVAIWNSAWFKGVVGEFMVNLAAKWFLDSKTYHLIKNVTLPMEEGTTQIDHIIVSPYGVFVVETKNMKGWIFGGEKQKTWTQKIFKHTQKFQNPLHQNYKHVKVLEKLLGLKSEQIHSVVVFVGDSTFKTPMPPNVTYGGGYIRYIKSMRGIVLTHDDMERVVSSIESGRLSRTLTTHVKHVKHVNEIVRKKQDGVACPKCGSDMVMREVKKGANIGKKFWGCSRFPSCRGAVNIA